MRAVLDAEAVRRHLAAGRRVTFHVVDPHGLREAEVAVHVERLNLITVTRRLEVDAPAAGAAFLHGLAEQATKNGRTLEVEIA